MVLNLFTPADRSHTIAMSATDYRNHFVNQSCSILNPGHYFGKHAQIKLIYQI